MSRLYVQSEGTAARRRFPVYLVDATDGITPETGETGGQPQISKVGGAWSNTTATLTAIGNGAYYVELTAAELDTLGSFQIRFKSANTAEFNLDGEVVALNIHDAVRGGLTALPNVNSGSAGAIITAGTGTAQLSVSSGRANADVTHIATAAVSTSTAQLGVNVVNFGGNAGTFASGRPEVNATHWGGTAVASAVVSANAIQISGDAVAADNLEAALDGTGGVTITAGFTGNITGNLSGSVGSVTGAVGSVTGAVGSVTGNVGGNVTGSVGSVTGNVGGNVAGSVGSLGAQAKLDVNAEADTALADVGLTSTITGRIDVAVSSRLATAGYTAPDNTTITAIAGYLDTEIAAIKAKTDNLPASPAAVSDIPTANQNRDAMLGATIETGFTFLQTTRIIAALVGGKITTAGQNPEIYRSLADSANRVTVTNDATGNRSSITYNA